MTADPGKHSQAAPITSVHGSRLSPTGRSQALGSEQLDLGEFQGRQVTDDLGQQVVGQLGVAGQARAVQIGGDDAALHDTVVPGARTVAAAVEVARRISVSDVLRLAGVAGYEGSLGHDRSPQTQAAVRAYIAGQIDLHQRISGLYPADEVFVTAGGSAK